ncbi:MAG: cysteine rich repeat-containing protein [Elusimicrobiota bacterium]|nr:cysteine rich repeat-containing protein [Elusimicrobiota bacterium]
MKHTLIAVFALSAGIGLALSLPAAAEKGKGKGGACAEDTAKFCKDVKPGEGRLAACLKEHEKELSQACRDRKARSGEKRAGKRGGREGATCTGAYGKGFTRGFKSGFRMRSGLGEKGGKKFAKAGKACAADREKFCAGVKPGEGRLRGCLRKNLKDLSGGCKARQEKVKERLEEKEKKG